MSHEEARTEVVTSPPSAETAPVYHVQLQPRPHVTFDNSVVDNEHLGRRRSKSALDQSQCCIFHKKREFGESSSESDEDSDDSGHDSEKNHHQHDCKHKAPRRRMTSKKRAPSSSEEKPPVPSQ
ncbi:unnamed protein product [Peronospora effusa]|nr:unnamed protein product [Peronospora effusa]CAI5736150.1 unnamed protein product [Peronospora farinosa]